jgi:hypothetical protein
MKKDRLDRALRELRAVVRALKGNAHRYAKDRDAVGYGLAASNMSRVRIYEEIIEQLEREPK